MALLKGVNDREVASLRQNRRLATLLYNSIYKKPLTEAQYMPLPGDEDYSASSQDTPEAAFASLAAAMGVAYTVEYNEPTAPPEAAL